MMYQQSQARPGERSRLPRSFTLLNVSASLAFALSELITPLFKGSWALALAVTLLAALIPTSVGIYQIRLRGHSNEVRRRFLVSTWLLVLSLAGTSLVLGPTVDAYTQTRNANPGWVEVLLDGASLESTVTFSIGGGRVLDKPAELPLPADSTLQVNGVPGFSITFEGQPGVVANYALIFRGALNMRYESDHRIWLTRTVGEWEDAIRLGKLDASGTCSVDPNPPPEINSPWRLQSAMVVRGSVGLDAQGHGEISVWGTQSLPWAVQQDTEAVVVYPTIATHTSGAHCVVGEGPVDGTWIGPHRISTRIVNTYSYSVDEVGQFNY